jgi:hypothetical protein
MAWGGGWLTGALPVAALLAFLTWQETKPMGVSARICRTVYQSARTARDTAVADQRVIGGRRQPGLTCGDLRRDRATDPPQ